MKHLLGFLALALSIAAARDAPDDAEIEKMSTNVRVDTGYSQSDPNPHYVDLDALREMSIKAYMEGGNYDNLAEWGINRRDMSLSLCFSILAFAAIMSCCCYQCQKHLMKDFYRLEAQARREAEAQAQLRRQEKEE